jgi:hypothetical protein
MNRKAILIEASNVAGLTDLLGARVDIDNWNIFLQSETGGAWYSSEIRILRKPTSAQLDAELSAASNSYCFVAFSGHGSEGSVALNDQTHEFPISRLKPKGARGTLILDSCRGLVEAKRYAFASAALANAQIESRVLLNASVGRSTEFRGQAILNRAINESAQIPTERFFWDAIVENSSAGIVEMLACAKGQAAGDGGSAGGYYTSLLLESASVWRRASSETGQHSTKEAHDYAYKNLPPQQTPEYRPSTISFPFAVRWKS